jgi:hypothetical protein
MLHPRMRWFLALSLGFVLACGAGESTDDTGATTGGIGCPAGAGIVADSRKVFAYTETWEEAEGYGGTWTVEVTDVRADGGWTTVTEGTYGNDEFTSETTLTTTGRCDDEGMWILEDYSETTLAYDGQVSDTWSRVSYDPGFLELPAVVGDGIAWTAWYSGTRATAEGEEDLGDVEYDFDARDAGEVETPAGTFSGAIGVFLAGDDSVYQYRDATVGDLGNGLDYELQAL